MKGTMLFRTISLATVATAALFAAQAVSATTIAALQVTDPHSGQLNLNSDIGTITIANVIITNPNSEEVTFTNLSANASFVSGNAGELAGATLVADNSGTNPNCGATLNAGASCDVDLVLTVTKNTGALNSIGDNGTTITADADETNSPFTALNPKTTASFDTHVTNDGPVPTIPEPGSLILLGTGMLGMAGMVWRKVVRG
jgi:hypothetical protein